ncbi:MAG: glycosyltransferase family 2 protein [Clostridiales bacterium]|nr:glycosyltransferase family 2 protein [Clostridiales bacterium]
MATRTSRNSDANTKRSVTVNDMELTILMPCLNEAETLAVCIRKAKTFLAENGIDGEVLISDNGSTDDSAKIAEKEGARVVSAPVQGYGSALIKGCEEAKGRYVIMGDCDDSYDLLSIMPFLEKLREGNDLVIGNRFAGGIEKGAMPWSHRYIGNPFLSFVGRRRFHSKVRDFHCGLRGYDREKILSLGLKTTGMEYASEMIVRSELAGLKVTEVPTTLKKDGRSRPPHLRSMKDGWRHLKFLLTYKG